MGESDSRIRKTALEVFAERFKGEHFVCKNHSDHHERIYQLLGIASVLKGGEDTQRLSVQFAGETSPVVYPFNVGDELAYSEDVKRAKSNFCAHRLRLDEEHGE